MTHCGTEQNISGQRGSLESQWAAFVQQQRKAARLYRWWRETHRALYAARLVERVAWDRYRAESDRALAMLDAIDTQHEQDGPQAR